MPDHIIRFAARDDAPAIARLANLLNRHEGLDDTLFTAAHIEDHGFGSNPAFTALVAEQGASLVGYAMFHDCYNSELPGRGIWLVDLFVSEDARGRGLGHALMVAVARAAVERSARSLWWGVRSGNASARAFYERLGALDDNARILELNGDALLRLAGAQGGPAETG